MKSTHIIAYIFFGLTLMTTISSCEDRIELESDFEAPQLVIDAWINNESETQTITLTQSQDYFNNTLPTTVNDATVSVHNKTSGTTYSFTSQGDGKYEWAPIGGESIGSVGDEFELSVNSSDEDYIANTTLNRVPPIDSISIYFEDEAPGGTEGFFAQLYARDLEGIGDTYWIRSSRNDTLNNKPQEISLAYDATFDAGTNTDGIYFIFPIRFSINATDDNGLTRDLNRGDKVSVELLSISNEAFNFLQIAQEQATNGDNTIFALPIANAISNIVQISNDKRALGFFNVAAVSRASKVVQ